MVLLCGLQEEACQTICCCLTKREKERKKEREEREREKEKRGRQELVLSVAILPGQVNLFGL